MASSLSLLVSALLIPFLFVVSHIAKPEFVKLLFLVVFVEEVSLIYFQFVSLVSSLKVFLQELLIS